MIRKLTYLEFPVFLLFAGLVLCSACTERTGIGSEPTEQMPATTLEVPSTSTAAALKSITATTLPLSSPTATVTKTAPAITAMPPTPPPSDKSAVSDDRLATSISKSDDDRWTAEGWLAYIYEEGLLAGYDTKLQVSSADGSLTWTLADYMQNAGLGATIPEILRWSSDGQHAFFTNRAMVDGCGDFVNGSDLFQGNLETGEVVELMPPLARSLSLSPDDSTVAYFPWGPMPDLILRNLATGEERALHWETEFDVAGNIVWSPDGQSLALTLSSSSCSIPDRTHTIVVVDVETLMPTVLVEDNDQLFVTTAWLDSGRLVLQGLDENRWTLDTRTGALAKT